MKPDEGPLVWLWEANHTLAQTIQHLLAPTGISPARWLDWAQHHQLDFEPSAWMLCLVSLLNAGGNAVEVQVAQSQIQNLLKKHKSDLEFWLNTQAALGEARMVPASSALLVSQWVPVLQVAEITALGKGMPRLAKAVGQRLHELHAPNVTGGPEPTSPATRLVSPPSPSPGALEFPPERPADFDMRGIPHSTLIAALKTWETNGYPVSSPAFARPAEALFSTWLSGLRLLGTRTLSMAEWRALIESDTQWNENSLGLPEPNDFSLIFDLTFQLTSPHEFHKFVGGFRDGSSADIAAGYGGERGLFARISSPFTKIPWEKWNHTSLIKKHWKAAVRGWQENSKESRIEDPSFFRSTAHVLLDGPADEVLNTLHSLSRYAGHFSDPREQALLQPLVNTVLTMPAHTPFRTQAARALVHYLDSRAQYLSLPSVSSATAEIHMLQVMHHYFQRHHINVRNPSDRLDVVALYELYVQLHDAGRLIKPAKVRRWLTDWKMPYRP